MDRPTFVYDLETYKDIFTFCIGDMEGNIGVLECSRRKNELHEILKILAHIKESNGTLVGFNNVGFDYPILHKILTEINPQWLEPGLGEGIARFAWDECQAIFNKPRGTFGIYPSEIKVHQTDLYLIHHFNNKARSTGLKQLEFAMQMDNIEDLPYPPDCDMSDEMMDALIAYNKHDVVATTEFLRHTEGDIAFRNKLSLKYDKDFTNFNDTKIGKQIFIDTLEAHTPGICYDKQGKKRIPRRTFRESLSLNEVIDPKIQFSTPEMEAVLRWMRDQTLISRMDKEVKNNVLITKDVFTGVDLMSDETGIDQFVEFNTRTELRDANTHGVIYTYRNDGSAKRILDETTKRDETGGVEHVMISKIAPNITAKVNGFTYVFGLGGIHGSVENKLIEADDEYTIMDIDVESYYPSLAIELGIYPEHLGEGFTQIYKEMRAERVSYAKGTTENAALKLGLNGTYGDSNSKFSPMYDPGFTMGITLNGQLYLAALAEDLTINIPDLKMIQINTDGMTVKIKKVDGVAMINLCQAWEKETGLKLEYQPYTRMWVADVNNYIAEKPDGSLKLKGRYNHDRTWSQNHSHLGVPKAAVAYLTNGDPIIDTLEANDDIFDFMMFAKAKGKQRLELWSGDIQTEVQKNCRYYISMTGEDMKRINPPLPATPTKERPVALHSGYKVLLANNMDWQAMLNDVDMEYYVAEAEKITQFERM